MYDYYIMCSSCPGKIKHIYCNNITKIINSDDITVAFNVAPCLNILKKNANVELLQYKLTGRNIYIDMYITRAGIAFSKVGNTVCLTIAKHIYNTEVPMNIEVNALYNKKEYLLTVINI